MKPRYYTLFETAIGYCGLIWKMDPTTDIKTTPDCPVIGFQLPEATRKASENEILKRWRIKTAQGLPIELTPEIPTDIPPEIQEIIRRVILHFSGRLQDFRGVEIDLTGYSPFAKHIYTTARTIQPGQTMTYGQLARTAGRPNAARAVGRTLGRNQIPLIIPCHRILASGGRPGGFTAPGGVGLKLRILDIEGVRFGRPSDDA